MFNAVQFVRSISLLSHNFIKIISIYQYNLLIAELPPVQLNHCQPTPCGPNSMCQIINDSPSCSCLLDYIGSPPQCRPECISNSECLSHQACINQKCKNPCTDSCGINAECRTISHTPMCFCPVGYTGDPFVQCITKPSKFIKFMDVP